MNSSASIILRRIKKLEKTWERKESEPFAPYSPKQRFYVAAVVRDVKNRHVVILNAVEDHVPPAGRVTGGQMDSTPPYALLRPFAPTNRISTRLSSAAAIRLSSESECPS